MYRLLIAVRQLRAVARGALPRALAMALLSGVGLPAWAAAPAATPAAGANPAPLAEFYIREYRVTGAHHLKPIEIETAVYPFLGPGRTPNDVQQAASALEKAYKD